MDEVARDPEFVHYSTIVAMNAKSPFQDWKVDRCDTRCLVESGIVCNSVSVWLPSNTLLVFLDAGATRL